MEVRDLAGGVNAAAVCAALVLAGLSCPCKIRVKRNQRLGKYKEKRDSAYVGCTSQLVNECLWCGALERKTVPVLQCLNSGFLPGFGVPLL